MNDKENAVITADEYEQESFDLDALKQKLEEEHKLIGSPDGIDIVMMNCMCEA